MQQKYKANPKKRRENTKETCDPENLLSQWWKLGLGDRETSNSIRGQGYLCHLHASQRSRVLGTRSTTNVGTQKYGHDIEGIGRN
ncbi:hypothetical protein CR513_54269, partial [Mucuna pruriens]